MTAKHAAPLRFVPTLLLAALLSGCQAAFFSALNVAVPDQDRVVRTSHAYDAGNGLALDLFCPAGGRE